MLIELKIEFNLGLMSHELNSSIEEDEDEVDGEEAMDAKGLWEPFADSGLTSNWRWQPQGGWGRCDWLMRVLVVTMGRLGIL